MCYGITIWHFDDLTLNHETVILITMTPRALVEVQQIKNSSLAAINMWAIEIKNLKNFDKLYTLASIKKKSSYTVNFMYDLSTCFVQI